MAQSAENKAAPAASDHAVREEADRREQNAISQAVSCERNAAALAATAPRHGAAATQETTHQVGQALRHGGGAGSEAARAGVEFSTTAARRGTDVLADGYRQLLDDAATRFEKAGRRMAETAQQTGTDLSTLMALPLAVTGNLRELQDSVAGLMDGVVKSNLRATQELFRLADPSAVVDLQHRFIKDYLDALMQGMAGVIHAARGTSERGTDIGAAGRPVCPACTRAS
jgi:hypothetical protein